MKEGFKGQKSTAQRMAAHTPHVNNPQWQSTLAATGNTSRYYIPKELYLQSAAEYRNIILCAHADDTEFETQHNLQPCFFLLPSVKARREVYVTAQWLACV